MTSNSLWILAVLGLNVASSEWLVRRTPLRHVGSALLVIVLTAVVANVGIIPTYSDEVPVYSGVFEFVAPMSIFFLLLRVHLAGMLQAGRPMLLMFGVGALGTTAGVFVAMQILGGSSAFGELYHALGGMFVGTYTGGSINFNAVAIEYGVVHHGLLYAGAAAIDNVATTVWMLVTVAVPRLVRSRARDKVFMNAATVHAKSEGSIEHDAESVGPFDLAVLLALGSAAVWFSTWISDAVERRSQIGVPSILILTTLALVLAQLPVIQRLRGTRMIGWLAVMLFLAVIGALCDLSALSAIGPLAVSLSLLVAITLLIHGGMVFGLGKLFRIDAAVSAVASQANVGGSTSALALARSLGRSDLMVPAILVGSLGNALGTYLGFLTAAWLG
jgi:uncharacterized membrane protein